MAFYPNIIRKWFVIYKPNIKGENIAVITAVGCFA